MPESTSPATPAVGLLILINYLGNGDLLPTCELPHGCGARRTRLRERVTESVVVQLQRVFIDIHPSLSDPFRRLFNFCSRKAVPNGVAERDLSPPELADSRVRLLPTVPARHINCPHAEAQRTLTSVAGTGTAEPSISMIRSNQLLRQSGIF